jgi:hypothetical protein
LTLIQTADSLFSKYCRLYHADESGQAFCICCGVAGHYSTFDVCHFIGRSCVQLRWSIDNCYLGCRTCHDSPEHLNKFKATLVRKKGEAFVENLVVRGKEYSKAPTKHELETLIQKLTNQLKQWKSKQF